MNMIGLNIRRLRQDNNMTQEELAKRLGMKKQTVSSWEASRTEPTLGQCATMAKIFGISIDNLVAEEGDFENIPNGRIDAIHMEDPESEYECLIAYMKMPKDKRMMIDEYIRFIANQK